MTPTETIDFLIEQQATYRPNAEVQQAIGNVTIGLLIGPSGIGKSYLIDKCVEMDHSTFSIAGSLTTRERRASDPENYKTGVSLDAMRERVQNGELVQYGMMGNNVYATDAASYATDYVLLPTLASSVELLGEVGFKKVIPIGIIAAAQTWKNHGLAERQNDPKFETRLAEAQESIHWLCQHSSTVPLVVNDFEEPRNSAKQITDIITGQDSHMPNPSSRMQLLQEMEAEIIAYRKTL